MIYRDFNGEKLSALGMGTMRLPVGAGGEPDIDITEAEKMFSYAYENGVNYFDTAYCYHEGNSESVTGRLLRKYRRDSYFLTDKFPGYDLANMDKVEEIFEEQLRRCGTEYFDFYLFHNVNERNISQYLDEDTYGIMPYLLRQKRNGRIRHLGFSVHGSLDVMRRFLDAYGGEMEFGQIQLNYLDWHFQNASAKVELLNERSLPVWVMEPVRGGRLSNLPPEVSARLKKMRDISDTEWAFRFLQSVPGVTVTLTGASSLEQLRENVKTFETEAPLSTAEADALISEADNMVKAGVLPCTGCRYCTAKCPQGLDIPRLIELYNEHTFTGGGFLAPMGVSALPEDKRPNACLGCKSCETVCPQGIKISDALADFSEKLGLKR